MSNKEKTPYLHIQTGADGNPEITLSGSRTEWLRQSCWIGWRVDQ